VLLVCGDFNSIRNEGEHKGVSEVSRVEDINCFYDLIDDE
jgi:hypothetical protein